MPIIMKKIYNIVGNYTAEQQVVLKGLIDQFRLKIADDDPEKNILNGKAQYYSDNTVIGLLQAGIGDINGGHPRTSYTLFDTQGLFDDDLIVQGAMIFAMIREGILQLRNRIDYSDSGLTIAMFNKSPEYQGWAGMMLQMYMKDKADVKAAIIPKSENSGFVGIYSEFGYRSWW